MDEPRNQASIPEEVKLLASMAVPDSLRGANLNFGASLLINMEKLRGIVETAENRGPEVDAIIGHALDKVGWDQSMIESGLSWCQATISFADQHDILTDTLRTKEGIAEAAREGAFLLSENASPTDLYPGMLVYFERSNGQTGGVYQTGLQDMDGTTFNVNNQNHVGVFRNFGSENGVDGFYTIEGNASREGSERDGVEMKFYAFDDPLIIGFVDTNKMAHDRAPEQFPPGFDVAARREDTITPPHVPNEIQIASAGRGAG